MKMAPLMGFVVKLPSNVCQHKSMLLYFSLLLSTHKNAKYQGQSPVKFKTYFKAFVIV